VARTFYVYMMTNYLGTTLYAGVTNNIARRLMEHREGTGSSFVARYKVTRLIYVEETNDVRAAIQREKEIKGWSRKKKSDLIATLNPRWEDLSQGWLKSWSAGTGFLVSRDDKTGRCRRMNHGG
jgi:putative endonuclease